MRTTGLLARGAAVAAVFFMTTGFTNLEKAFAPKSELWERWEAHDPDAATVIDHSDWSRFLAKYVYPDPTGVNLVSYIDVTEEDRTALQSYLDDLQAVPISTYNRAEQEAYWLNLYNAVTVEVILDHFPVKGIRDIDISPGFFSDGPWGKDLVTVEGEDLSLNDIEHRILRPIWGDPRVHYAVNCASIGCPNLLPVAFTGETLDSMKSEAARAYVNHPRGVTIEGETATISKIYLWFSEDFGETPDAIKAHLMLYADPALAAALTGVKEIEYAYDWALNDGSDPDAVAALSRKTTRGDQNPLPN